MNPFGIFVCILWGTVALFSVLSFVTVVHNNRRNLKRAQAVVIGKNVSPSGRTSTARASDAKTDYIILFSIGGVTRSLFAGQALYTDLQVGDHGTLSYRDGPGGRIHARGIAAALLTRRGIPPGIPSAGAGPAGNGFLLFCSKTLFRLRRRG